MINLEAPIIPNKSIGGISIGDDFKSYLDYLQSESINFQIRSFDNGLAIISIDNGTIQVTISGEGIVLNLACRKKYMGLCKGLYFPGMNISEILAQSEKQLIIHGFLIIDRDFGFGFEIPREFEDCDYAENLPKDFIPERLYVFPEDQWGLN